MPPFKRPAASPLTPASSAKKIKVNLEIRPSLNQTINNLRNGDPQVLTDLIAELEADEIASRNFRWASHSTDDRQDRHLSICCNFIATTEMISQQAATGRIPHEATEKELDLGGFPAEHDKFLRLIKRFLIYAFRDVNRESLKRSTSITQLSISTETP